MSGGPGRPLSLRKAAPRADSGDIPVVQAFYVFNHTPTDDTRKALQEEAVKASEYDFGRALHKAVEEGNISAVTLLGEAHRDWIDVKGQDKMTSFLWALTKGKKDISLKLVELGADVHATDENGHGVSGMVGHSEDMQTFAKQKGWMGGRKRTRKVRRTRRRRTHRRR
jgi:hypothetical protein